MKLLRHGPVGAEKPGLLDVNGRVRDLSDRVPDINPDTLEPERLAALAKLDPDQLPVVSGTFRYGVPVANIGKLIAIGLNYADHAEEAGMPIPAEPVIFTKAISSQCGANDDVIIPKDSQKTDWEVELAIIIGKRGNYIDQMDAMSHIAGFSIMNDVSERAAQIEMGGQWVKGKSYDTFAPLGPWVVTPDEIPNPQNLKIWLEVNDKRHQDGNTSTMIFGVTHIVSYVSQFMTLMPGDVITTGTPPGVGLGMKPPVFLKPGDVMHLGIESLGEQKQKTVAWSPDT